MVHPTIHFQLSGSFVLRMMNLFLGEETFRTGVSNYLKKHAYGNAEQDDLWESLTEVAHKNQVLPQYMSVKQIMDSWTVQTGYPLITVIRNYEACTAVVFQVGSNFLHSHFYKTQTRPTLHYFWSSGKIFG